MTPKILYNNLMEDGTISVTGTDSGYDKANLIDNRPYTFWQASAVGTYYIKLTLLSAADVNAVGICGHNLGTIGATIELQYNSGDDEAQTWETVTGTLAPSNDNAILLRGSTSRSSKWFRLKISGHTVKPHIGVMFVGETLSMEFSPTGPRAPFAEGIEGQTFMSRQGNVLAQQVKYNPITIDHQFLHLTRSWLNTYFMPFWNNHAKLLKPFFYAVDLDESTDEAFFCWMRSDHIHRTDYSILTYVDNLQLSMRAMR